MATVNATIGDCGYFRLGEEYRTHVDGTFYQMPRRFPCVLHDRAGCLFITQEQYQDLVKFGLIRESTGGAASKINISKSISAIPVYRICPSKLSCPRCRARK